MSAPTYDRIGLSYSEVRRSDPRLQAARAIADTSPWRITPNTVSENPKTPPIKATTRACAMAMWGPRRDDERSDIRI